MGLFSRVGLFREITVVYIGACMYTVNLQHTCTLQIILIERFTPYHHPEARLSIMTHINFSESDSVR